MGKIGHQRPDGGSDDQKLRKSWLAATTMLFVFLAHQVSNGASNPLNPAKPVNPIEGILAAFRSHTIVALGEGNHNNEQGHAFRLSLIRDPRFPLLVNDIVVEFGNSRYQDMMDRFVRGENVPAVMLRQVWQNTTQSGPGWDSTIYEEFFRAVRAVNSNQSRDHQLRVLLGDPPVDWNSDRQIQEQIRDFGGRDDFPLIIVRKEVLAWRHRALMIFGDGHFKRRPKDPIRRSVVDLIEASGVSVFTVNTNTDAADLEELQPNIAAWPVPSLSMIRGTVLEQAGFRSLLYPSKEMEAGEGGFDAILYLGHPLTITFARFSKELCQDSDYIQMRTKRRGDVTWGIAFKALCEFPPPVLPQLWRTYLARGISATITAAPAAATAYSGGFKDLYRLAQAMLKRQRIRDAIEILELNSKLFPRDIETLRTLAQAYAAVSDPSDYWRSYQRVLALDRHNPEARHALGLDR